MDTQDIKQTILDAIVKTEATVEEYKDLVKPEAPDVAIGRVSRMDAINNRSVVEAALRKAEEKLKNLYRVLEKIDSTDFGKCMKCKNDIPLGRILIRPESLLCIQCAH
ncbi:MAG: TraR/DksA C4-type zinc finger protein [Crocinitomicaceae bacterium]|nr:TraR/DksA C4-type zinc finger protein [Crocinitomicaceae bacterium]